MASSFQRHIKVLCGIQRIAPMCFPCCRCGHCLTTKDVVIRSIVQNIESLLLAPKQKWNARHLDGGYEMAKQLSLKTIMDSWPAKHVLVRDTVHMTRVEFSCIWIDEVVGQEKVVPHVDPVRRGVVTCFQVTVHAEEPRQGPIDRIVECSRVKCFIPSISQEILILRVVCHGEGSCKILGQLVRLTSTA